MEAEITTFKNIEKYPYFTNDIKLTAALITKGFSVDKIKYTTNKRNNKKEIHFGFEETNSLKSSALEFLSGKLVVDAKSLLDNRDSLLSFVANGSREVIDQMNKVKNV